MSYVSPTIPPSLQTTAEEAYSFRFHSRYQILKSWLQSSMLKEIIVKRNITQKNYFRKIILVIFTFLATTGFSVFSFFFVFSVSLIRLFLNKPSFYKNLKGKTSCNQSSQGRLKLDFYSRL